MKPIWRKRYLQWQSITYGILTLKFKNETFRGFPWVIRLRYIMENAHNLDEVTFTIGSLIWVLKFSERPSSSGKLLTTQSDTTTCLLGNLHMAFLIPIVQLLSRHVWLSRLDSFLFGSLFIQSGNIQCLLS
jgi:hypothetical protein